MIRKRKKFDLRRILIAQARRVFWYYYRSKCMKYHNLADTAGYDKGHWKCVYCEHEMFRNKDVQIDHIEPVMDTESASKSWDVYFARLFVEPEKTQPLCKTCHRDKTQFERQRRTQNAD